MISIVIPCRNEAKSIRDTVQALLRQTHQDIEILVVDGISEDGTREILAQLSREDARVRMIDNPNKLTPFAFNLGVKNARGEFVQIVGARNILAPDYLQILLEALNANPQVACVGGDFQHTFDTPASRFISLAMESKFGVGGGNYRTMQGDRFVDTVGVPLYRKAIFSEVGYFDENLTRNQDDDFNFRLTKKGYKILYVHAAKTSYLVRGSLTKAFDQYSQYGYFKVFVNRKHKAVTTLRQLVPALFVAFLAVCLPLMFVSSDASLLVFLAGIFYVGLGSMLAGPGLTLKERLRVVNACFVLHVGYGMGYWQGIFDFILRQRPPRIEFQRQTL